MKQAAIAREQKRIEALARKWEWIASHAGYAVWYAYHTDEAGARQQAPVDVEEANAWTTSRWKYADGLVNFRLDRTEHLKADELEELVLHELLHIVLAKPVTDSETGSAATATDHEERAVSYLARAFLTVERQARKR